MNRLVCYILLILISINFAITYPAYGCDDTLVMLLTAKNPSSEFSKSIRAFMNALTVLGSSLKYNAKDDYSEELKPVLEVWLEFSKKYMTNPPEEAKNDRNWISKMSSTAKKIGEIRKQINNKNYLDAHNNVLELSNTIGTFFEAVGITDEKQVFITTSADINDLQRLVSQKNTNKIQEQLNKIRQDYEAFKKYIAEDDSAAALETAKQIESVSQIIFSNESSEEIDNAITSLRTSFEELRSRILMKEWFSSDEAQKEGN